MGKGVFIPPIDPEPVGLIEPLDWLNKTRRKREASKTRRKFATIGLILISIVGGVFFWDYKAYQKVEAIEQAYAQEPAKIYGEYSKFIKMHLFSEITGYRQKALEKCQKKIEQYLTAKNRIPEYMSVNDYKSLIAQLREWCLELSDRTFTRKIESDIQSDVLPNLEIVYANELEAEINQVEFEAKFMEFVSSFPKSRFIRRFHGKKLYMQIYQLVGSQKKIDIKKFKRIISLCDRYQKETSKYGSEYRESIQKLRLFLDKLKTNKTMGREHMIVYNGYAIQDGLLGTHKELHKKCEDVPVKKYRSEGLWIFKRVVPYTAWEERCQDEWVDTFNSPEVIVKVIVNESEVFRSKPNNHKKNLTHDVFRFYWTPGNRITVAIENKTGQSVQKRQGGLLGINILQGDLDIGNVATVRFQGRDLEIPTLQVP